MTNKVAHTGMAAPRGPERFNLGLELAVVFAIWVLSDAGYYFVLPMLGVSEYYNVGAIGITLYYLFWIGTMIVLFWPAFATWPRYARWRTFNNRLVSASIWVVGFGALVAFATRVVPWLPPFYWPDGWGMPPQLPLATPAYLLPKSAEILFQQLEVLVVVLLLASRNMGLKKISLYGALLFGAAHLLLVFSDVPIMYVVYFTISASLFGLIFPFLVLRVSNGFAVTYVLHWSFYAITLTLVREFGPGYFIGPPGS